MHSVVLLVGDKEGSGGHYLAWETKRAKRERVVVDGGGVKRERAEREKEALLQYVGLIAFWVGDLGCPNPLIWKFWIK